MMEEVKINNLLFSEHTQYKPDAAKKNHFKNSLEKKNTGRRVLKMFFSPEAIRATMKSIDRSPTETTAAAATTEALSDP